MPLRRLLTISGAVVVAGAIAVTAGVLSAGPVEHVRRSYTGHRTFVSTALDACVVATVRGTAVATRSGTAPLVRWTDVRLLDPTVTAAGYGLRNGRCDRSRPLSLAATLEQRWSGSGGGDRVRRSDIGPATGVLSQFNSGTPVDLPDRGFPAAVLDPGYGITGQVLVDARFVAGTEGFGFPLRLDLRG